VVQSISGINARGAVEGLRAWGYEMSVGEDALIHIRRRNSLEAPAEAKELLAWCRDHRSEIAAELAPQTVRSNVRTCFFSCDDTAMLDKWKSLQARQMVGIVKVYAHQRSGRVDVHYEPLVEPWVIDAELYGHESL